MRNRYQGYGFVATHLVVVCALWLVGLSTAREVARANDVDTPVRMYEPSPKASTWAE